MPSNRCWGVILCQFLSGELLRRGGQVPSSHTQAADLSVYHGGYTFLGRYTYVESGIERLLIWLFTV